MRLPRVCYASAHTLGEIWQIWRTRWRQPIFQKCRTMLISQIRAHSVWPAPRTQPGLPRVLNPAPFEFSAHSPAGPRSIWRHCEVRGGLNRGSSGLNLIWAPCEKTAHRELGKMWPESVPVLTSSLWLFWTSMSALKKKIQRRTGCQSGDENVTLEGLW